MEGSSDSPEDGSIEVERKVRVKDADGEDVYELTSTPEGISIRSLKVRFNPPTVPADNLRSALAALDS